jgi:hypothetical protein
VPCVTAWPAGGAPTNCYLFRRTGRLLGGATYVHTCFYVYECTAHTMDFQVECLYFICGRMKFGV